MPNIAVFSQVNNPEKLELRTQNYHLQPTSCQLGLLQLGKTRDELLVFALAFLERGLE